MQLGLTSHELDIPLEGSLVGSARWETEGEEAAAAAEDCWLSRPGEVVVGEGGTAVVAGGGEPGPKATAGGEAPGGKAAAGGATTAGGRSGNEPPNARGIAGVGGEANKALHQGRCVSSVASWASSREARFQPSWLIPCPWRRSQPWYSTQSAASAAIGCWGFPRKNRQILTHRGLGTVSVPNPKQPTLNSDILSALTLVLPRRPPQAPVQ